jgi:starch phosphorylase
MANKSPTSSRKSSLVKSTRYLHANDDHYEWMGSNHRTPDKIVEDDRSGMSVEALRRAFTDHLYYTQGVNAELASIKDIYLALAHTIRDRLMHRWIESIGNYFNTNSKAVFYLSAEYLMGQQMGNNLLNTRLFQKTRTMLAQLGLNLYAIMEQEDDPGLGNGGLGRLAACFLDSLATIDIPALGYGIRYDYGIFKQEISDGWQIERPDSWLKIGNPWEIPRRQLVFPVQFGGHTSVLSHPHVIGGYRSSWSPDMVVLGTPYDTLVPGFATNTVNTLRLWSARADRDFDFESFNAGDFARAVADKTLSETISKVLYPNDHTPQGKELRLKQQYFFVSCSLQDAIRIFLIKNKDLRNFHKKAAIQLNDTHPAVAVAELMRLLIDEHFLSWEDAWNVTSNTFGYTNHTLLPEALEKWSIPLFGRLLPRILEIVYEINHRFLEQIKVRFPGDNDRISRMSLIEEGDEKQIRMAHLATVGSHAVNGVAKLHTHLVKNSILKDFNDLWPEKFINITNGITPRRWLMLSNLKLTALISEYIGVEWIKDLNQLKQLERFADDDTFIAKWQTIKLDNKRHLAHIISHTLLPEVDPNSLFDVLVKRIHEYKRQLLLAFYIVELYLKLKDNPQREIQPRTFIISGKAAPGYLMAKLIIKFINSVADVVNNDKVANKYLRVVFLPNFSVSLAERIYPAADLSEQISLAGKEASGTGNMKFSLNGALNIGTLDGANIEIRDAIGAENFFLFGMTVDEVQNLKARGYYPPYFINRDEMLRRIVESLISGMFSNGDTELFRPIYDSLTQEDPYCILADYVPYSETQELVNNSYQDQISWTKKSIRSCARMGYFSSDRSITEYCNNIWNVKPSPVTKDEKSDYPTNSHTIEDKFYAKRWGWHEEL